MRFSYIGYQVDETPTQRGVPTVYRPIVPIRMIGAAADVRMRGLIDSGADETILTGAMAEAIGASVIPGVTSRILSAGGDVSLVYASITLELKVDREIYRWPAVVGVADGAWDEAMLGFRGFLEYFDATLLGHALELELVRNTRPFGG